MTITTEVTGTLNSAQTQEAIAQANAIANSAQSGAINSNTFVYFAAFDGTSNDEFASNGDPQTTNVRQLFEQVDAIQSSNISTGYFRGHGTEGSLTASSWLGVQVTQQSIDTAQLAYDRFAIEASDWLQDHPGGDVTTAITAFSRGDSSAAIFSQMLYSKGLVDPATGQTLIPPGQVGVSAGVIFDAVTTGVGGNMAFAPNVENVVVIRAENEYRYQFKAQDYSEQLGVTTVGMYGNHCNIGGCYDNGIGALVLEGATGFLQNSGLAIADVDPARAYTEGNLLKIYDEGFTTNSNGTITRLWDTSSTFIEGAITQSERLLDHNVTSADITSSDQTTNETFTLYNGHEVSITRTNDIVTVGEYGSTSGQTGMFNMYNLTTGVSLGSASSYDGAVYPNYTGQFGSDLSTTLDSVYGTFSTDSSYAAGLTDFRSFAGVLDKSGLWGGKILFDGANLTQGIGSSGSLTNTSYQFTNIDFSEVFSKALADDTPGKFFITGSSNSGSIGITYVFPSSVSSGSGYITPGPALSVQADNDGYYFSFSFSFPIALDLDGDGIELINRDDSHAYFDMTGSGYRNHTGWVAADDGFLVLDINHDNKIDQAKELSFALWTDTPNDTDLEGLKATFDNNHDNVIDQDDDAFIGLRVWQDKNGNGISEEGELKTLTEAGITSINLDSLKTDWSSGGNSILGFSTYDKTSIDSSGNPITTQGFVGDVALGYEDSNWQTNIKDGLVQVSQSGGLTYALGSAEALKLNLTTSGLDGAFGNAGNDSLIATGKNAVVLEGGAGNDTLQGGSGDDWLNGGAGIDQLSGGKGDDTLIIDSFDNISKLNGGAGFDTVIVTGDIGITLNLTKTKIEAAIGGDGNDSFSLNSASVKQTVALFGGAGDDSLTGGARRDILEGGTGNDTLSGNLGNDVYMFSRGDGKDVIVERSTGIKGKDQDTLLLGTDISLADVVVVQSGNDLLVGIKAEGVVVPASVDTSDKLATYILGLSDHIVITNWVNNYYKVENIGLADGGLYSLVNWIGGTSASDSGASALHGDSSKNVLSGGAGGDAMFGGAGNDTYVVDHIDDVVVELAGKQGKDTVVSTITYTLVNNVENLTLVGTATIDGTGNTLSNVITGNAVSNKLDGGTGNDTLDGGAGVDTLLGGVGNDTYHVDNIADVVTELSNADIDLVISTASNYILSANVENLTLVGNKDINGVGNNLDNMIIGNAGNNQLDGGAGQDTMIGGLGNDTYLVNSIADKVTEKNNGGTDTIRANLNYTLGSYVENLSLDNTPGVNEVVALKATGNTLDNQIYGNDLDNTLTGLTGDDTLVGGLGKDTMLGGIGDDSYFVDNASDIVTEALKAGTDTVYSSLTFYTLGDNLENLTLSGTKTINGTGNKLDNILIGNSSDNVLDGGAGNDTLYGRTGKDTLTGGAGNDTFIVGNTGDVVVETIVAVKEGGTDIVFSDVNFTLTDNVENLALTNTVNISGTLATNATGNILNNYITGNNADNILDGLAGNDSMAGGFGDDTYIVDNASDQVYEQLNQGIDNVITSISLSALVTNVENVTLIGNALTASGNSLNNIIIGNELANTLKGGSGNDLLDGGLGNDSLEGSLGHDTFILDSLTDKVKELVSEGTDTVITNFDYILGSYLENLTLLDAIGPNGLYAQYATGNTANNILIGNSVNNQLAGLSGNDTLDGGMGADIMVGGAGNDTYIVDNANDIVIETNPADGTDTVNSSVSYLLTNFFENLTLTGVAVVNGSGNSLNNLMVGNVVRNILEGGLGNDSLDGGIGVDTLRGGAGNDTYFVDSADDIVSEVDTNGIDTGGIDVVNSSARTYLLLNNVENLTLLGTQAIDATGNSLNNYITGNAAANILDGGLGNDTLAGGLGDDTYIIDSTLDIVKESTTVNQGIDTIISSLTSYTLGTYYENLILVGAAVTGIGNGANNKIVGNAKNNTLNGGSGNDLIYGNDGDDSLLGGAGNDIINGGIGKDYMAGSSGNDLYVVDDVGDVVYEITSIDGISQGNDSVESSISITLAYAVENLALTGGAAINGIGNTMSNTLTGNTANNSLDGGEGNDTLDGGSGDDTLIGGLGNDLFMVDSLNDVVIETSTVVSTDSVKSTVSYTLSANVENLTLLGEEEINGNGNELNNLITGNIADNVLDGSTGKDTLIGGLGDDTYVVDITTDVITEILDEGIDVVFSSSTYTLGNNLENLTLTGTLAINGIGNALDNELTGNDAANSLNGSSGNDVIEGLDGKDTLIGGDGDDILDGGADVDSMSGGAGHDVYMVDESTDVVVEAANSGVDTIYTDISYILGANVENLILTGVDDINATGNILGNVLTSNSGVNILRGLAGDDTYEIDGLDDEVYENVNEGIDKIIVGFTYTLDSNIENLELTGASLIDGTGNELHNFIVGNTAANKLSGGNGNDTLDGGGDIDTLIGGIGNDSYFVDDVDDVVSEAIGEGIDIVQSTALTFTLAANLENLTLIETADIEGIGNELNNTLIGNVGSNVLDGGLGKDTMKGGLGDDVYFVNDIGDALTELSAQGTDEVISTIDFDLTDYFENLTLIGNAINGIGNSTHNLLVGNSQNNLLKGGGGNDTMDGSDGADTMEGSVGDDVYFVDNVGDLVKESAPTSYTDAYGNVITTYYGTDTVQSSITWTLGSNIEKLILLGDDAINGTGNTLSNALTGNSVNNSLDGGSGNDTLDGGAGDDTLIGGLGNDVFVVDSNDDVVIELLSGGTDTVQSSVTYSLASEYVEYLTLIGESAINAIGNVYNNKLTGNIADNILDGGAGIDTMAGGYGNDLYYVDNASDAVIENLEEGVDTIVSSVTRASLAANIENITLIGSSSINATGNTLNNYLIGNAQSNSLTGIDGDDTLDGGAGADILTGGVGNDTYVVDNIADSIVEATSAGTDTVQSSISFVLGNYLENLTLIGVTTINATGNTLNNLLTGNEANNQITGLAGNDTLNGGAGNDTMIGGLGNDTYVIDSDLDIVQENVNEGLDTIVSTITISELASNIENLTLDGIFEIDGIGNALNNVITGNAANNLLNGDLGKDTLIGGAGNDTYIIDVDNDVIIENDGEGEDVVLSSSNYILSSNLESLTLTGELDTENLNGTGNELNNKIIGNQGNNILTGLDGNDTLDGGIGLDTLVGGLGDDTYNINDQNDSIIENVNEGVDTIYSKISYTLDDNIENLTLTSNSSVNANGNALNNTLSGNDGDNILNGEAGSNILTGGLGQDSFELTTAGSVNSITDFTIADDTILFDSSVYTSLIASGVLNASWFKSGVDIIAAMDSDDYIIYDSSTGALYYDELGDTLGSASAVQIATLSIGLNLTNNDFVVI